MLFVLGVVVIGGVLAGLRLRTCSIASTNTGLASGLSAPPPPPFHGNPSPSTANPAGLTSPFPPGDPIGLITGHLGNTILPGLGNGRGLSRGLGAGLPGERGPARSRKLSERLRRAAVRCRRGEGKGLGAWLASEVELKEEEEERGGREEREEVRQGEEGGRMSAGGDGGSGGKGVRGSVARGEGESRKGV